MIYSVLMINAVLFLPEMCFNIIDMAIGYMCTIVHSFQNRVRKGLSHCHLVTRYSTR